MADKLAVATAPAVPESEAPTLATNSIADAEKASAAGDMSENDARSSNRGSTAAADAEKQDGITRQATAVSRTGQSLKPTQTREDGTEYPSGMKLALITLALCLSVFLMALGTSSSQGSSDTLLLTDWYQTIPSLRPPSPRSPISFRVYLTWVGMEVVCLARSPL